MSTFDGEKIQMGKLLHLQLRFLQTSNRKRGGGGYNHNKALFLGTWPLAVLRWPACSEWIMSVRLCEAVPCPPERRGNRQRVCKCVRACCEWTLQDEFI